MDVYVYGTLCPDGREHEVVWELLATAVGEVFGLSALPMVVREQGGKPYFPDRADICFNLSHSYGSVVCAVHDRPIGIDIEKLRPAPKRLADGMDDLSFFRLWTAREASAKREGKGIAALLRPFEPNPLCRTFEGFLPDRIVTVCPSECAEIHFVLK